MADADKSPVTADNAALVLGPRFGLSPKQVGFVLAYAADPSNQTKAAVAGGYSPKIAPGMASTLLRTDKIQAALAEVRKAQASMTLVDAARVVNELALVGFSDMRGLFTEGGRLLRPHEWPTHVARAVKGIKVKMVSNPRTGEIDEVLEIQLWEKPQALALLARHTGLLDAGQADPHPPSGTADARARALALLEKVATGQARLAHILEAVPVSAPAAQQVLPAAEHVLEGEAS